MRPLLTDPATTADHGEMNMTAGQRNCYTEIAQLVARYSIDDVLFSACEVIRDIEFTQKTGSAEQRICRDVVSNIEQQRGWLQSIKPRA